MIYVLHKKGKLYNVVSYHKSISQDVIDLYPTKWGIKASEINNEVRWVEILINDGPDCVVFFNDKNHEQFRHNNSKMLEDAIKEFKVKRREEKIDEVLGK